MKKPQILATLAAAAIAIPISAVAWLQFASDDTLTALSINAPPLLTTATLRTVTDERPARLVPTGCNQNSADILHCGA